MLSLSSSLSFCLLPPSLSHAQVPEIIEHFWANLQPEHRELMLSRVMCDHIRDCDGMLYEVRAGRAGRTLFHFEFLEAACVENGFKC
jgi:hypothetical protein